MEPNPPCINCKKNTYKDCIGCDMCGNWVCYKCSKLSRAIFDEINTNTDSSLKFSCCVCAPAFPKFSSMSATLHEIKSVNKERFDTLESKVNSLEVSIRETVSAETKEMKDQIRSELSTDINKVKADLSSDIAKIREELKEELDRKLKEKDDIAKREKNLFFYHVKESTSENAKERLEHDKAFISELCSELGTQEPKMGAMVRFGKHTRTEKGDIDLKHPRPLRVTFLEKSERRHILNNAKILKTHKNKEFHNTSISRDLTIEERQKRKELESELNTRRAAGESNLRIRGNKIVTIAGEREAASTGQSFS